MAFTTGMRREYTVRGHTYRELKARGLGARAAQRVIKKGGESDLVRRDGMWFLTARSCELGRLRP
ncbi:hypothetical protein ACQPZZ_11630 [Microbispora sp. CA-135349]|uniref:hypothetical protein n=1 Tax=Microbispora sp. CA-135349 TaxID=3239953 RepID=UPI003D8A1DF7